MAFVISPEDRLRAALKKVPDFDGRPGNPCLVWLQSLEHHCRGENNLMRTVFHEKMNIRSARVWYNALPQGVKSNWPALRARFLSRFIPVEFFLELNEYLEKRRQLPGESVSSYHSVFEDILDKLGSEAPSMTKICRLFRTGLKRSIRKRLMPGHTRPDFEDLSGLVEQAKLIESDKIAPVKGVTSALLEEIDTASMHVPDSYLSSYIRSSAKGEKEKR